MHSFASTSRRRRQLLIMVTMVGLLLAGLSTPPAQAESGASLTGVIADDSGDAISGAVAELCPVGTSSSDPVSAAASDSEGTFTFSEVEAGTYTILFHDPLSVARNGTRFFSSAWLGGNLAKGESCGENRDEAAETVTVTDGDSLSDLQGVLPEGGRVVGVAKDPQGALVDEVSLSYDLPNGLDGSVRSGWPGPGQFRTEVLTAGTHEISFRDETTETMEVEVIRGQATTVEGPASATLQTTGRLEIEVPRRDWVDNPNLGVGTVLKFPIGWQHHGVTRVYEWTRDGVPIQGADDAWYALTAEDAGHVITVSLTGTLPDHQSVTVEARDPIDFPERSSTVEFTLAPDTAPLGSSGVIHAVAHVNMDDGSVPEGEVIIWDDSHGEQWGWHFNIVSGRPNANGDVVLPFPDDFYAERGDAYAEFVPDDAEGVNGSFSEMDTYRMY